MANLELTRRLVAAQLRDGWRNLVVLGVLVGLAGGVAIAAFAGARRTDTALERVWRSSATGHEYRAWGRVCLASSRL